MTGLLVAINILVMLNITVIKKKKKGLLIAVMAHCTMETNNHKTLLTSQMVRVLLRAQSFITHFHNLRIAQPVCTEVPEVTE